MKRFATFRFLAVSTVLAGATTSAAPAVANELSEVLPASVEASVAVPLAGVMLMSAGGQFSVAALRPLGDGVELVLRSAADGASVSVRVTADLAARTGLAIGSLVEASAVSAGWLLISAGEVIAYVPNAAAAALIHERELR